VLTPFTPNVDHRMTLEVSALLHQGRQDHRFTNSRRSRRRWSEVLFDEKPKTGFVKPLAKRAVISGHAMYLVGAMYLHHSFPSTPPHCSAQEIKGRGQSCPSNQRNSPSIVNRLRSLLMLHYSVQSSRVPWGFHGAQIFGLGAETYRQPFS